MFMPPGRVLVGMTATKGHDVGIEVPEGWTLDDEGKTIGVRLKLKDFMSAVGLVNEIAMIAEELDHHPDLHLTGWNKLEVRTYSHDVGALTERDVRIAERINVLLDQKGIKRS